MKQAEKQRLTSIVRDAIERLSSDHPAIKLRAEKLRRRFSPTNADSYREISEFVWWLIAVESYTDAMRLLNALCEVEDDLYWMFHALASSFATRAWLKAGRNDKVGALHDAHAALQWLNRDPNPKPITKAEVRTQVKRFDAWLERADGERGPVTAASVLSHALRVLVIYQQAAIGGDAAAKGLPSREFDSRINTAIRNLREWIDCLSS